MPDGLMLVIGRMVTQTGCARTIIYTYLAEYEPGAGGEGMTLLDVLVSPPICSEELSNTVTITWTLPSPQAWWEMTGKGRPDPTLGEWWSRIDELVVERT